MQRYCTELTERLLKSLDKEYNVVDMGAVVDVITALEKTTITKEVLEITRLGKYINELRRKTSNDALAKRAKDLVRRWRDMVLPSAHTTPQPTPADTAPQALNGTKPQSPALRGLKPHSPSLRALKPHSPALKSLKPHSPLMRDATPLKVLSPALSLNSEHSRSPNPTPPKQPPPPPPPTNHRPNSSELSPRLTTSTSNHSHIIEAVPRTHSSNKRLRKEEASPVVSPGGSPPSPSSRAEHHLVSSRFSPPSSKRPRLNGDTSSLARVQESSSLSLPLQPSRPLTTPPSRLHQVPDPREPEKTHQERSKIEEIASADASRDSNDSSLSSGPKKRGRKKGSKSLKAQNLPEDRVKEKLASISRNPKLKTTQELLADLQARGSTLGSSGGSLGAQGASARSTDPPSTDEILRNEDKALSSRFLRSGRENKSSYRGSGEPGESVRSRGKNASSSKRREVREAEEKEDATRDTAELSVEDILAKLPPLDLDAISWSEEDDEEVEEEVEEQVKDVTEEDVDRLHCECVEGLNGNFQTRLKVAEEAPLQPRSQQRDELRALDEWTIAELKKKGVYRRLGVGGEHQGREEEDAEREFREWHEMLARPSYQGQTLHILPYVIID